MYRNTWLEVNLSALQDNLKKIQSIQNKKTIAVIKANGYGCGDLPIAKACMEAGAAMVAVSSLDEALALRNKGFNQEILILGYTEPSDLTVIEKHKLVVVAPSLEWIQEVTQGNCSGLRVHLGINTGMNRIGLDSKEEAKEGLEALLQAGAKVEGIFTHYAEADDDQETFTQKQFEAFKELVTYLDYPFQWVHASASEAGIHFLEDFTNAFRLGIGMYGFSRYVSGLKTVVSLYTRLSVVRTIHANDLVGYGGTYVANQDEIIGTVPVGYADGWLRRNQGRQVMVQGQPQEIIGRICMDQMMIKLDRKYPIGTEVELFGENMSLQRVADELGTITYEILVGISDRVTREYLKDGQIVEETMARV